MNCDANTLIESAKCFNSCIPPGLQAALKTYLLAQIAAGTTDPNQLIADAKCLNCIPPGLMPQVEAYLIQQWSEHLQTEGELVADDWADRVVANGGTRPSAASIAANANFVDCMIAAGLWTKMIAVNTIAPDNLIAALTPLLVGPGNDPWTNNNFVVGDLSIQGLVGDGATKYLQTGLIPATIWPTNTSIGMTAYRVDPETDATVGNEYWMMGSFEVGPPVVADVLNYVAGFGAAYFYNPAGISIRNDFHAPGFYSGNRTAANLSNLYFANGGIPHASIATSAVASTGQPNVEIYAFAGNVSFPPETPFRFIGTRLSFLALHEGLTQSEDSAFYDCVQALRVDYGGGYIADNDSTVQVMEDFDNRLAGAGGAPIALATRTALETFWNAIIAAGIHTKMYAVNCVLPDGLIAACTPVYRCDGFQSWTNVGPFVAGDLTVNGLVGDGLTKYMQTGSYATDVYPQLDPASDISRAGLTAYLFTDGGANKSAIAALSAVAARQELSPAGGTIYHLAFDGGGGGISAPSIHTGYVSGNRISLTDNSVYIASSLLLPNHQLLVSNNTSGGALPTVQYFAWGLNNIGVPANLSDDRMSLVAIHDGLTATESEAFYNAIQALRTALGGGTI